MPSRGYSRFSGKRIQPPDTSHKAGARVTAEEHAFILSEAAEGKGRRSIQRMFFRKFGRDISEQTVYNHIKAGARHGE